jgi:hypothetical protein
VLSRLHEAVKYREVPDVRVDSPSYKRRSRALAKVPVPSDKFPNELYTWFSSREKDFTNDEIKLVWEYDEDDED